MASTKFTAFRALVQMVQDKTGLCQESVDEFNQCETIQQLVQVFKKYWGNLLDEAPQEFLHIIQTFYDDYRKEMNDAGMYFNEYAANSMCIIGDMPSSFEFPFVVDSHINPVRVYILGKAKVVARGITQVFMDNASSYLILRDSTRGTVKSGHTDVCDRAVVTTSGTYTVYGNGAAYAGNRQTI